MISEEKRQRIVAMHERGYRPGEIADALGVSCNTVGLWLRRHEAGEGTATRPYPKTVAPPVGTTQAGYVVAGLAGWFTPAEAQAATGVADSSALLKVMRQAGAVEGRGRGPAAQYRSLVTPREWLNRRGIMQGSYPFEDKWPVSCDKKCHEDRDPPSNAPGTDYAAPAGTPVLAIARGTVRGARWRSGGGRSLWVDHGDKHQSYYAHFRCVCALNGERVEAGQTIGYVGSTGKSSTGPHLHLSVKRGSVWLDPELVIDE